MNEIFTELQMHSLLFDAAIAGILFTVLYLIWRGSGWASLNKNTKGNSTSIGLSVPVFNRINKRVLFLLLASPFLLLATNFMVQRLDTRIDSEGIHYRMFPGEWKENTVLWRNVLTYTISDEITSRGGSAFYQYFYSISDKHFLIIYTLSGRTLYIGTQKPDEMRIAMQNYCTPNRR